MTITGVSTVTRRGLLRGGAALAALAALARSSRAADKMKIGVLGAGNIGSIVGGFLAGAGYPVMLSARDTAAAAAVAAKIGHGAQSGSPGQAAAFGEVIVMAVPWGALPQVGRDYAAQLKGKIVIDTCNPIARRDGDLAKEGLEKGTGVTDPQFLPGTRLVRAFNSLGFPLLAASAHHAGELIAVPLASDDRQAMDVVAGIVRDCGFAPVIVGGLATAKSFDGGTPDYNTAMTASQLRAYFHM